MRRTLSFMVMAFALLFAQCRKPEVKFPTPSSAEGVTVSMTVTAGPGSKTDITDAGVITWSEGDKLYVGYNDAYVGYLTLTSGQNTPTGWFSGNVTLPTDTENGDKTFHFFYLGSVDYTGNLTKGESTTVDVDFSSQNIYADVNNKLVNASAQHVGYGSANGTVTNGVVTGINVTMVSKVALARFSFTEAAGKGEYTGPLTLSGTGIYNKMTVKFNSEGFDCEGTEGNISLTGSHAERYVMLVPAGTGSKILHFSNGDVAGSIKLGNGIEANKFYREQDGSAIEVTVKPKFSVAAGTKVEFAPGNLYWDGTDSKWKFEENQWSSASAWNASHVSHFFWSNTTDWQIPDKEPYAASYSYSTQTAEDVFFTNATEKTANPNFQVSGETAGTWRTLSIAEWDYLLNTRSNASNLRARVTLSDVNVSGIVILPDGSSATASGITTSSALAGSGAVFLPAAGSRQGETLYSVGTGFSTWTSTNGGGGVGWATCLQEVFGGMLLSLPVERSEGYPIRLVR